MLISVNNTSANDLTRIMRWTAAVRCLAENPYDHSSHPFEVRMRRTFASSADPCCLVALRTAHFLFPPARFYPQPLHAFVTGAPRLAGPARPLTRLGRVGIVRERAIFVDVFPQNLLVSRRVQCFTNTRPSGLNLRSFFAFLAFVFASTGRVAWDASCA